MAVPAPAIQRQPLWHYWIALLAFIAAIGAFMTIGYGLTGVGKAYPGFLGTNARLASDLNLTMQTIMAVAMTVGIVFVRRGDLRAYRATLAIVVLTNVVMILFIMGNTMVTEVLPERDALMEERVYLPVIHGTVGLVAEFLGAYLLLLLAERLPTRWRVRDLRWPAYITYALWMLAAVDGVWVYAARYQSTGGAAGNLPVATTVASENPQVAAVDAAALQGASGRAVTRDHLAASDQLLVRLEGLPNPPPGQVYRAWLTGAEGQLRRDLGIVSVDPTTGVAEVRYNAPNQENLLAQYEGFFLTIEPEQSAAEPGSMIIRALVSSEAMEPVRRLLVSSTHAPDRAGLLVGLREQTRELVRHANLLRAAERRDDLEDIRRHAEHIVLLIEGLRGPNFGDLDGDRRVLYPGDGLGLLSYPAQQGYARPGYVESVINEAAQAAAAEGAPEEVTLYSQRLQAAMGNVEEWLAQIHEVALTIYETDDPALLDQKTRQIVTLAQWTLNGVDTDGDGLIEAVPGEAGVRVAYRQAQLMAQMPLSPLDEAQPAPPAVAGTVPTLVVGPTPTATVPPAAPNALTVPMVNFAYVPRHITIRAGTTVTFLNQDPAPHDVTADNHEFHTDLIGTGESGELTFTQAGTFDFYCSLHGGPGGQGMSGTLTVEP
jgi:plastocyanin/uncharacterized membrane protein YozB (DUF420 family)